MQPLITAFILATAVLVSGCASLNSKGTTIQKMTWKSPEEAMNNYRLVKEGKTTVNELIHELGFDPEKVSMALRIESPTEIRNTIMGVNPNVRYEDITKNERACLDAKEYAQALKFPIRVTTEESEGNVFLEKLKFKKQRRETGKTLNVWFCYNADTGIVLYKTVSYGHIDQLRKDSDPIPDIIMLLLFRGMI